MLIEATCIIIVILIAIALFWICAIFFVLQKSLNEFTKGMNSLDERLSHIEAALQAKNDT